MVLGEWEGTWKKLNHSGNNVQFTKGTNQELSQTTLLQPRSCLPLPAQSGQAASTASRAPWLLPQTMTFSALIGWYFGDAADWSRMHAVVRLLHQPCARHDRPTRTCRGDRGRRRQSRRADSISRRQGACTRTSMIDLDRDRDRVWVWVWVWSESRYPSINPVCHSSRRK